MLPTVSGCMGPYEGDSKQLSCPKIRKTRCEVDLPRWVLCFTLASMKIALLTTKSAVRICVSTRRSSLFIWCRLIASHCLAKKIAMFQLSRLIRSIRLTRYKLTSTSLFSILSVKIQLADQSWNPSLHQQGTKAYSIYNELVWEDRLLTQLQVAHVVV